MSIVNVTDVSVNTAKASPRHPFEFEVWLEALEALEEDIDWRLIYVGDAEDKTKDQELESISLGPIARGCMKFGFSANAPDFSKIPYEELYSMTVILLTGSYRDQEFVRIGYYVDNRFIDPELELNPPESPEEMPVDVLLERLERVILVDSPRVTRFSIKWDRPDPEFLLLELGQKVVDEVAMDNEDDEALMSHPSFCEADPRNENSLPSGVSCMHSGNTLQAMESCFDSTSRETLVPKNQALESLACRSSVHQLEAGDGAHYTVNMEA